MFRLWAGRASVAALLAKYGLGLSDRPHRKASHPLFIELWQVRDGQLSLGGMPLRDACGIFGAAAYGLPSGALHASLRALDRTLRPGAPEPPWLVSGARVVRGASELGARLGRGSADTAIARFGCYREMLITLPGVKAPNVSQSCQWVLGMYTDSPLARLGAQLYGFGFGKELARIERDAFTQYDAFTLDGRPLLRARFVPAARERSLPAEWRAWLEQPLLGTRLAGKGLGLSHLRREWSDADVRTGAAIGTVSIGAGLLEGLFEGPLDLTMGVRRAGSIEGLHIDNLPVELSFPRKLTGRA
jgi:hypothetical protein